VIADFSTAFYGKAEIGRPIMRITLEADYAIRIMDCLTGSGERLCAKTLSDKTGVSHRFALKILRKLCMAKMVRSHKGIQGGYELIKKPEEISLKDVIEAIDGPIIINRCQENRTCSMLGDPELCAFHSVFAEISNLIDTKLTTVTFDKK
jgi:Rrf2 family iron-sulfur cluster assembly transcriptional regulator